jgi:hypothetical protein
MAPEEMSHDEEAARMKEQQEEERVMAEQRVRDNEAARMKERQEVEQRTRDEELGCAFRRNSGGFRRNSDTRHRPFRFRTGTGARMCYNTILDIPVYSGWYLSTRFLRVENACNYSK